MLQVKCNRLQYLDVQIAISGCSVAQYLWQWKILRPWLYHSCRKGLSDKLIAFICQRSTKNINRCQCKHHGNWSPTSARTKSLKPLPHSGGAKASISRLGLGLCISFIRWNAKRNIFLVYRRKTLLNGNVASKGQKACILHVPLKYCFSGKRKEDLRLHSFNTPL